eukprot:tig00000073_g1709.t1
MLANSALSISGEAAHAQPLAPDSSETEEAKREEKREAKREARLHVKSFARPQIPILRPLQARLATQGAGVGLELQALVQSSAKKGLVEGLVGVACENRAATPPQLALEMLRRCQKSALGKMREGAADKMVRRMAKQACPQTQLQLSLLTAGASLFHGVQAARAVGGGSLEGEEALSEAADTLSDAVLDLGSAALAGAALPASPNLALLASKALSGSLKRWLRHSREGQLQLGGEMGPSHAPLPAPGSPPRPAAAGASDDNDAFPEPKPPQRPSTAAPPPDLDPRRRSSEAPSDLESTAARRTPDPRTQSEE